MTTRTNSIAESAWQTLMGKIVGDLGATTRSVLVLIGRRLRLYKAMAELDPFSAEIPFNLFVEARR